jgi:LAO/AO transport system kinase
MLFAGATTRWVPRRLCSTAVQHRVRIDPLMAEPTRALLDGILAGDRVALSRGITLIESTKPEHNLQATLMLDAVLEERARQEAATTRTTSRHALANYPLNRPSSGVSLGLLPPPRPAPRSFRLGLAGAPGAGKSSLIEALGMYLTTRVVPPLRVAVLAVDPSSSRGGGSILGDKTRMNELSRQPNAYVRPSPTRGALGGVAQHTNDVALLCEGAGYDVVIVETVGLGQSEVTIDATVDMTLLVVAPAGETDGGPHGEVLRSALWGGGVAVERRAERRALAAAAQRRTTAWSTGHRTQCT